MSTDLRHREIEELLGAYALDARRCRRGGDGRGAPRRVPALPGRAGRATGRRRLRSARPRPPRRRPHRCRRRSCGTGIAVSLAATAPGTDAGPAGRPTFLRNLAVSRDVAPGEGVAAGAGVASVDEPDRADGPAGAPADLSAHRRRRTFRWPPWPSASRRRWPSRCSRSTSRRPTTSSTRRGPRLAAAGPGAAANALQQPGHQLVRMDSSSGSEVAVRSSSRRTSAATS